MITVPESVLERFRAFSLYNSPYRAHDDGCAIDLYPEPDPASRSAAAPSPVAGEVVAIEQVRAPPKPYAPEHDSLIAIDTGRDPEPSFEIEDGTPSVARILHVDPEVAVGDRVSVGDELGDPIRAGFFAPWVDHHLHLGFRRPDDQLLRAAGSLSVAPAVDVEPVSWDGTGTVVETAATYAVLDRPDHPDPGNCFAGVAGALSIDSGEVHQLRHDSEESRSIRLDGVDSCSVPLDGGLPHYDRGGVLPHVGERENVSGSISLLGQQIGTVSGRTIEWTRPAVTVDGTPIEGLSIAAVRDDLGAKLICPDLSLSVGEQVHVRLG